MRAAAAIVVALAVGCGGAGWQRIVTTREISAASGAPSVGKVTDLGDVSVPPAGDLPKPDSDGRFVVGEAVLIEGSSFGKLPTVLIGGRPAAVLARTHTGAIVTRVPAGVSAGTAGIEVSHPGGKSTQPIEVHRYALVAASAAGRVYVADVTPGDAKLVGKPLDVVGPRRVEFAGDGSFGYVAAAEKLAVVAMGASGGPRVTHSTRLDVKDVVAAAVAPEAGLLVVVGARALQSFTLVDPRHPAAYEPTPFPGDLATVGVIAADLQPAGTTLAVLLADGNRVAALDLSIPEAPKLVGSVVALPGERLPLARDLRWSADGETLWVISGDNLGSIGAGKQPTRLTTLTAKGLAAGDAGRSAVVAGASAPLRIAVPRGRPLASGTTIRVPTENAPVFVAAVDPRLLQLEGVALDTADGRTRARAVLEGTAEPGMVVRTDAEGRGGPMFTAPALVTALDVSPDARTLLATTSVAKPGASADALLLAFGLAIAAVDGAAPPRFLELGELAPAALRPPFDAGAVRIQP